MNDSRYSREELQRFIDVEFSKFKKRKLLERIAGDQEIPVIPRFGQSRLHTFQSNTYQPDQFVNTVRQKIEQKLNENEENLISVADTPVFERFKKILEEACTKKDIIHMGSGKNLL